MRSRLFRFTSAAGLWLASGLWLAANEVKESRATPWTPEETRRSIVFDGEGYEAQLVAAEPLVLDPVEMCWDAQGRCFVADMIDYPLGGADGKPLSRIQRLIDDDGDSIYDRAETFAAGLDHAQGLLPHWDGLIVTTRTQVLFLRDTDGDGVADERRPLIAGFNPGFSQLQIASPRWGLDGALYFNNGLDSAEIYPAANEGADPAGAKLNIARHNLRWHPATGALTAASGFGQYGGGFDDWGRHFFCSNRSPVMFAVLPHEALEKWPASGLTQGWENIAPHGPASRVHPLAVTHTTSDAHSGTNTSACGLAVYRGDLMPELRCSIFVCDPTGQLITRFQSPAPRGTSLATERVGRATEFFRSRDEWCRPVNLTTGPDGALYVCDIYRRHIDHARFFPDDFLKTHDIRAGEHHGRIWRIVPKGKTLRRIEAAPHGDWAALVRWLRHDNAWQRETAQRLLLEKAREPGGAEIVIRALEQAGLGDAVSSLGKLHFLWTWAGAWSCLPADAPARVSARSWWLALAKDAQPELIENMVLAAFRHPALFAGLEKELTALAFIHGAARPRLLYLATMPEPAETDAAAAEIASLAAMTTELQDAWFQGIVLGRHHARPGQLAEALIAGGFTAEASESKASLVRQLAALAAALPEETEFAALLGVLRHRAGELSWWKPALLQGLAEALPLSPHNAGAATLSAFAAHPVEMFRDARREIGLLLAQIEATLDDDAAPLEQRLACLPLLAQRPWEEARPRLRRLLGPGQPPGVTTAAFAIVRRFGPQTSAPLIYEILPAAGPRLRQESVAFLCSHPQTQLELFRRMAKGEVPSSLVDAETRWHALQPGNAELNALAGQLFQRPSEDRAAVIAAYLPSTTMKGDAAKGRELFDLMCLTCHSREGRGVAVGPDISDTRAREKTALLSDILDPNRMVEARWTAYRVETTGQRTLIGIMEAETAEGVILRLPGGARETIAHTTIAVREPLPASLMPVGLEAGLSVAQMADLLAFLAGE